MDAARKGGERRRLRLVERGKAREVPRRGGGHALRFFDTPRRFPAGGVIEIQIDAAQVRLPAGRERDIGIPRGNGRRRPVFRALRRTDACGQIRPVRVDQRDKIDHRVMVQLPRRSTADRSAVHQRIAERKQPLPDGVRRDCFVCVVPGGDKNLPAAGAELQRVHAAAEGRARERFDVDKRKLPAQAQEIRLLPARGHGNRIGNQVLHGQNTLQHIHMPEGALLCLII